MQHLQSWKGCVPSLSRDWTRDVTGGGSGTAVGDVMLDDHPGIDQITTIMPELHYALLKQLLSVQLFHSNITRCK